jgi:hypothetical protein
MSIAEWTELPESPEEALKKFSKLRGYEDTYIVWHRNAFTGSKIMVSVTSELVNYHKNDWEDRWKVESPDFSKKFGEMGGIDACTLWMQLCLNIN